MHSITRQQRRTKVADLLLAEPRIICKKKIICLRSNQQTRGFVRDRSMIVSSHYLLPQLPTSNFNLEMYRSMAFDFIYLKHNEKKVNFASLAWRSARTRNPQYILLNIINLVSFIGARALLALCAAKQKQKTSEEPHRIAFKANVEHD